MIRVLFILLLFLTSLAGLSQRGIKTKSVVTDTLKINVVLVNLGDTILTINPTTGLVGYKTISAYDVFIRGDTLFVNDTAFGYYNDVNKWIQSGGKIYPTTSTDDIVATDSLRVEGSSLFKGNIKGNGTFTLIALVDDATADSLITIEDGVFKRSAFSVIIDTIVVLFKYDTIRSVTSAKIATKYDTDTLSLSVYDTLTDHLDSIQSHNTRINVNLDSIASHNTRINTNLDSISSHNTRINTNLDSISAHNTRINNNVDTLAVHLDSLQSHNDRINLNVDSIAAHNTRILALKDSIAVHLDTLQSHNTRILALFDTASIHLDSLQSHNDRINALADTATIHLDTLQSHNTRINTNVDSLSAIRTDLNATTNALGDTARLVVWADTTTKIGTRYNSDTLSTSIYDSLENIYTGTQTNTLLSLKVNIADSTGNTSGNYVPYTRLTNYLDSSIVLFKYDTISSTTSAKIATEYDVDTLSASAYDSLNIHWDTLVLHNTRILGNLDSLARHTDTLQSHNTRILANLDSITRHTDTLQSHNTRILATLDSLDRHTDTLQSHNLRILALKDSLAVHLDSLQAHNTRLLSLSDTVSVHLDSLQSHNNRINAIINSLGDNVYTAKFSLSVVEIALLGSLICVQFPNIPDSGYVQVLSAQIALYAVAQLDVGTQTLALKYQGGNNIVVWTESQVESAAGAYILAGAVQANYSILETQWLGLQLSASTNPGGVPDATMDLYVTFRYIDMSGTGGSAGCP